MLGSYKKFLTTLGTSLVRIGLSDKVLARPDAIRALSLLNGEGSALLGGDVYFKSGADIEFAHASWDCKQRPDERDEDFLERSLREARAYIRAFPASPDREALFALVLKRQRLKVTKSPSESVQKADEVKLSAREEDGYFSVEVGLGLQDCTPPELAETIQTWFDENWMARNKTWTRVWSTGARFSIKKTQILHYNDEFRAPPKVDVGKHLELRLHLLGTRHSKFWKDWLVSKIAPDLKFKFGEVGDLLYIRNRTR